MTSMVRPYTRIPTPGFIKFTICVEPSLVSLRYPQFFYLCLRVDNKIVKEVMHVHYTTYMAPR